MHKLIAMVLCAEGRFIERNIVSRGKKYKQYLIYVPKLLALDSQFPFKPGDKVLIKIDGKRLIIEKQD